MGNGMLAGANASKVVPRARPNRENAGCKAAARDGRCGEPEAQAARVGNQVVLRVRAQTGRRGRV